MEAIGIMRARHRQEVDALQSSCSHPKVSDWTQDMWAPGHFSRFEVKVCKLCGKEIGTRTKCCKCGKMTEDYRAGMGTHSRPGGTYYCPDCFERTDEEKIEDESISYSFGEVSLEKAVK